MQGHLFFEACPWTFCKNVENCQLKQKQMRVREKVDKKYVVKEFGVILKMLQIFKGATFLQAFVLSTNQCALASYTESMMHGKANYKPKKKDFAFFF